MFSPSAYQQAIFDWVKKDVHESAIVEAVAGSGKTTTLLHAIQYMKGNVFLGMFNKQICVEIKAKLANMTLPKQVRVNVSTLHAAGLNALTNAIGKCEIDGYKLNKIFTHMIEYGKVAEEEIAFENSVVKLVSFAKQHGFNIDKETELEQWHHLIEHYSIDDFNNRNSIVNLAKILFEYNVQGVVKTKIIDFDDMLYMPLRLKAAFQKYDWVLIDEAQDTNHMRREICLKMMHNKSRLIAIGDRHQAIYGFTGADANSLELIGNAVKAKLFPLHVSYRCPKNVVKEAQKYVNHIQAFDTAENGLIQTIDEHMLNVHAKVGDAILCRFNAPLVSLIYQFIAKGIPAKIEGREIGAGIKTLVKRWKSKTFDELLDKLDNYLTQEEQKLKARNELYKFQAIEDKVSCAKVIINRVITKGLTGNPADLICKELDNIFGDKTDKSMITLSSIHKSKGLEWHNVFLINTGISPYAKLDWEIGQEYNLLYVAITRAQKTLTYVTLKSRKN